MGWHRFGCRVLGRYMQRVLRLCAAMGFLVLAAAGVRAQASEDLAKAQEDFAVATATAHARSSLFGAGTKPFAIHATVDSRLALRGTGRGTYDNRWVDAQHWQRVIQFPDFRQTEMRNDAGHSWVEQSSEGMPLRIAELLRVVVIHVPSSNTASRVPVSESSMTGDGGELLNCYSGAPPTPPDGFARRFRYCFDRSSGLLVSQDMPLNTHIVYSNYIAFQGKQEFTHVRVTSGGLPVLDMEIQYAALDPHALDGSAPDAFMHRSESAGTTPNPEELSKGTAEYRPNPLLPPGTPEADKDVPVVVQFHVSADNTVLDACVEDAPTEAMGEAALEAAKRFTFTPLTLNGRAIANRFYYSIWFRRGGDEAAGTARGSADAARSGVASGSGAGGVYRSGEPGFVFRYPADLEQIPRGELEEERHSGNGPHQYGLDPGAACNTLLFKAQRLRPEDRKVEVVSIYDLSPNCIFGVLDRGALATMAVNAGQSITSQWAEGDVSKPRFFTVSGRTFAVVSLSGTSHRTEAEELKGLVVETAIRGHVVAWTILGPGDHLAQTLAACTLQTAEERESSFQWLVEGP